ncbi:MAG: hypothetical protein MJZ48_04420 [Paludibacteraceae bacterium]|nr:hypothetical protein [Paludibacteraceae bacterium]
MIKKWLYSVVLLLLPLMVMAGEGSPSSRFGFGEMNDNISSELRAMGGVVAPMRSNHTINPSQPASYTAGDSLSFMFDIAASVGWTNYRDSYGKKNVPLGMLDYVTLQFPLWKRWIAFSCGIMPYTHVDYNFTIDGAEKNYSYHVNYAGEGGLSQVYGGLGFNVLDWFAVGANFYYIFGTVTNSTILSFNDATVTGSEVVRYTDMSAFRTKVGAQLFHTFGKHTVLLGATFDPKLPMGGDYLVTEVNTLDTIIVRNGCEMPMAWSVGANYTWNKRLTLAADYSRQMWSDALYFGQKGYLHDRQRVSVGVQYQHNPFGIKYHQRMVWRLGAAVMNSYAVGDDWQDFSISLGVGFPLRTSATMINATVEYGRKTSLPGLVENITKLTVDVAVNESWFHKRKL